jgi:CO/xanthine dehydrogenase FAD-binding subunit
MDLNGITEICRPRERRELPAWRPGDAVLAGGTWLFSEPQPGANRLVDLTALGWPAVEVMPDGLRLGATCTLRALERLELPPAWLAAPLFRRCCRALSASFKVAAAATVGGNLCLALPAAPMAPLVASLDGECLVWTPEGGERLVPAEQFVLGERRTALLPGEVLRRIDLPAPALRRRAAFRRASLAPHGRSAALLIGTLDPGGAFALTVAASVAAPLVLRFRALPGADDLAAHLGRAIPDAAWWRDVHGSPDWRRHMTHMLAEEIRQELASA